MDKKPNEKIQKQMDDYKRRLDEAKASGKKGTSEHGKSYIDRMNRSVDRDEFVRQRVLNPTKKVLEAPSGMAKRAVNLDEEENSKGIRKTNEAIRVGGVALGNVTDISRTKSLILETARAEQGVKAADRILGLKKTGLTTDASGAMTEGDLVAFKKAMKNPKLSDTELQEIRDRVNLRKENGGILNLSDQKTRKRADFMMKNIRMNEAENFAEGLMEKHRMFSPQEQKILKSEDSIFKVTSLSSMKARDQLVNHILSNKAIAGELSQLNWDKMTDKQLRTLLSRKSKIDIPSDEIRGLIEMKLEFRERLHRADSIRKNGMKRGSMKGLALDKLVDLVMADPELRTAWRFTNTSIRGGRYALKAGTGAGKLTYKAGRGSVSLAARGVERALNAAGQVEKANVVHKTREAAKGLENRVAETAKGIVHAPMNVSKKAATQIGSTVGKGVKQLTLKIAQSKVGQSAIGRGLAKGGKKAAKLLRKTTGALKGAVHISMAPLRGLGKATDFLTKKLLLPVALALGAIILVQMLLIFFGGTDMGSSVTTIILDTPENFQKYQAQYQTSEAAFMAQISGIINGYAKTLNKKGSQIHYGVNGAANAEGNTNDDYKNGVFLNFDDAKSNNLEDILSVMAVIMQQESSSHPEEAKLLIDALYRSSHTYQYQESPLYPCPSGCETTHYNCNLWKQNYGESDLRFAPWLYEDIIVPTSNQECVVCREAGVPYEEYAGCTVTGTCYHGDDGDLGEFHDGCDNYEAVYSCPGHEEDAGTDENGNTIYHTEHCDGPLGCEGYYECKGHSHYGCPDGHDVKTCYGHVDIQMDVNIMDFEQLFSLGTDENAEPTTENTQENMEEGDSQ